MRIIMMGTGPYAVPTLRALGESEHEVVALVTRPERPGSGGRRPAPNPMRDEGVRQGLPILAPESINTDEARAELAALRPDLLVVCDYGQILKSETLAIAPHGGINLHASLLPKYRGAAPIQWAVFSGETETGDSVIHMTAGLDAGPIVAQRRIAIGPDETAGELEVRLAELGAELVLQAVHDLETGRVQAVTQDRSQATKAPRILKEQGQIDWSRSAQQIKNQIRAFDPWPRSFTDWRREGREPIRLILHRVAVLDDSGTQPPGTVLEGASRLLIATGDGVLEVLELQPAGKRTVTAAEYLRGYPLQAGERLGL